MLTLVFANINGRRGFSLVTAAVVALGTTTFLVLVGLTDGTFQEIGRRMTNANAELMVYQEGWTPGMGAGWPLRMQFEPLIDEVEGVAAVVPVKVERLSELKRSSSRPITVYGIRPADFAVLSPGDRIVEGRPLEGGFDMLIDEVLAHAQGISVGERFVWLGGQEFTVVGIARRGVPVRIFVDAAAIDRFHEDARGRASFFFVKCDRPEQADAVAQRIEAIGAEGGTRRLSVIKLSAYLDELLEQFSLANKVIYGVTVVSLITSSMIIFLTMYQAVTERTREIGILKSLGASRRYLAALVLSESLALCAMGIGIGIALSLSAKFLIETIDPTLMVGITPGLIVKAAIAGLAGGALGAIYPGYLAAQRDPVVALTYE